MTKNSLILAKMKFEMWLMWLYVQDLWGNDKALFLCFTQKGIDLLVITPWILPVYCELQLVCTQFYPNSNLSFQRCILILSSTFCTIDRQWWWCLWEQVYVSEIDPNDSMQNLNNTDQYKILSISTQSWFIPASNANPGNLSTLLLKRIW